MTTMKNQNRSLCVILPNNIQLNITVGVKERAQDVFNQLSEILGITGVHVFGLSVMKGNQLLFLDLEQKLSMYLPKSWRKNTLKEKVFVYLKVQYFVESVHLILNGEARELYYTEMKTRVLSSLCHEQEGLYFQLAAYALQAELGDYTPGKSAYFRPQDFFPFWVIQRRGKDYILEETPALHKEIKGMSPCKAAQLFIQDAFTLRDVPVTIYTLLKGKRAQRGCVLLGVASTGLQISEMLNGEHRFLYDLGWSSIHSVTFQGRKFEVRADGLNGGKLVFQNLSVQHSKHLLQHISNSHQLHLNTKLLVAQFRETKETGTHREMYVTDIHRADMNMEDSDDELPQMKFFLANLQNQSRSTVSVLNFGEQDCTNILEGSDITSNTYGLEMSVDEPVEMLVDDPEVFIHLVELLEGVSVNGALHCL